MSIDATVIAAIMEAKETFSRLRGAAFDAAAVLDRIEGARQQMSATDDELRHQITNTRDRVAWLISELDQLNVKLSSLK